MGKNSVEREILVYMTHASWSRTQAPFLLAHHVWPVKALAHAVQVVGARAPHDEVVRHHGRPDKVERRDKWLVILLQPGHDRLHEVRTKPAQTQPDRVSIPKLMNTRMPKTTSKRINQGQEHKHNQNSDKEDNQDAQDKRRANLHIPVKECGGGW